MKFIAREFPSMAPRFERLYAKKYPPDAYRKEVQGMVRVLQARYGLGKREERATPSPRTIGEAGNPSRWGLRGSKVQPAILHFSCDVPVGHVRRHNGPARLSTTISPSRALTTKCEPSFQLALIGSLIFSSMMRLRKRAPKPRL